MVDRRVVIVTGASGGLGTTLCETFEKEGATVIPVDLNGENVLHLDIGTAEGNRKMVDSAVSEYGRLDVLILNAGVQFVSPLPEFPENEWDRLQDIMVKGPFLAIKAAWEELTRRPGSRIVVTASGSSYLAEKFKAGYVSAKHGVLGLVKVAAIEGAPYGLTANAVAPGWMKTPLVEKQLAEQMRLRGQTREEVLRSFLERQPADRFVETSEVAAAVAFLASEAASGISGACLPVDLGALAW